MEDPSKYGVVVSDENNLIDRFVEKPKVNPVISPDRYWGYTAFRPGYFGAFPVVKAPAFEGDWLGSEPAHAMSA